MNIDYRIKDPESMEADMKERTTFIINRLSKDRVPSFVKSFPSSFLLPMTMWTKDQQGKDPESEEEPSNLRNLYDDVMPSGRIIISVNGHHVVVPVPKSYEVCLLCPSPMESL